MVPPPQPATDQGNRDRARQNAPTTRATFSSGPPTLTCSASVIDQVVVGVPDDEWGHRVHAIVQPVDPRNPPTAEELRALCKERLASYKVPKTVEVVERIPRTEAGKLNRTRLGEERGGARGAR